MKTLEKTGRTTRMMEEALAAKATGREVIVIVKDEAQRQHIEGNFDTAGLRVEPINAHPHFDWRRLTIPGAGEKFAFFVDHYVIEEKFAAMLEMLHRFDPPTANFLIMDDPWDEEQIAKMRDPENQKKIKEWMDKVLGSTEQKIAEGIRSGTGPVTKALERRKIEAAFLPTGSRGRPANKEQMEAAMQKVVTDAPDGVPTEVATVAKCQKPPAGWTCTLPAGHDGPCAAVPTSVPEQELIKAKMPPGMVSSMEDDFRHSSIRLATDPRPDSEEPTPRPQNQGRTISKKPRSISKNPRSVNKGAKGKK